MSKYEIIRDSIFNYYNELQDQIYNAKSIIDDEKVIDLYKEVKMFESLTYRKLGKLELLLRLEKIKVKEDPLFDWVTDTRKAFLKSAIKYCQS